MANLPRWRQVVTGHRARAGTMAPKPTTKQQYDPETQQSPFGGGSPFGTVNSSMGAVATGDLGGTTGTGASLQAAIQAPFIVKPGTVTGMGPYVAGGQEPFTPTPWKGGPLGAVPNHHGWAGLQNPAKEWTLRILGAFPGLRFSSGYRSPAQNKAANGHPNSGHMRGWKIDLSGDHKLLHQAAAWAKRYGARTLLHDAGSGYHLDISWEGVR